MSKAPISHFGFFPRPSLVRIAGLARLRSLFDLVVSVRFALLPIFAFNISPSTFLSSTFISSSSFPLYG